MSLSGYLGKRGDTGLVRQWKVRYFELKGEQLHFAEDPQSPSEGLIGANFILFLWVEVIFRFLDFPPVSDPIPQT